MSFFYNNCTNKRELEASSYDQALNMLEAGEVLAVQHGAWAVEIKRIPNIEEWINMTTNHLSDVCILAVTKDPEDPWD